MENHYVNIENKNGYSCILSEDRFQDYKDCWEYVNKIAKSYNEKDVKVDFDYDKEYASIILETKRDTILPEHDFMWHCLFSIPDRIEIMPSVGSKRLEFIFNTEIVEERIEKYSCEHLDEILRDIADDEF